MWFSHTKAASRAELRGAALAASNERTPGRWRRETASEQAYYERPRGSMKRGLFRDAATLGLGGDSRKQRIDFHIIQPLQCSGQVLRQEMVLLRGQAVRTGFARRRPGRRHGR